jgi:hypothetical protein
MTRIFWAILYYVIAIPCIIFFQRKFQSDSGPGLNVYAFIVVIVYACYLLFKDLRIAVLRDTESFWPVFVHLIGISLLSYLIFFDEVVMQKR